MLRFVIHPVFVKCRQDLFCGRLASLSQSRLQWGQRVLWSCKRFFQNLNSLCQISSWSIKILGCSICIKNSNPTSKLFWSQCVAAAANKYRRLADKKGVECLVQRSINSTENPSSFMRESLAEIYSTALRRGGNGGCGTAAAAAKPSASQGWRLGKERMMAITWPKGWQSRLAQLTD